MRGVCRVFCDDNGARVVSVAVGPADELESDVRRGGNLDGVAVLIGATTSHCAHHGIVGDDFDGVLANSEQGDKGAVLEDNNVAGVACDAIVPA